MICSIRLLPISIEVRRRGRSVLKKSSSICAIAVLMSASNRPPSEGFQFFGGVKIDAYTKVMTVTLRNLVGETLYRVDLPPET